MADFVIVIYNPKSKKQDWQIKKRRLIFEYRYGSTLVATVSGVMRENQNILFANLDQIGTTDIDMNTVV